MSTFPSVLSTYTNPQPSDRLNSPSHSSIESAQNSGVSQLEAVIGVEGASSVVGSFQYLVKSPASNGGGHVQTAILGGTGQTTFTKGDILVAQSASVLAKLSVGVDNQILAVNSSTASGINWVVSNTPKISTTVPSITVVANETYLVSVTLYGSTLGISNAVRTTVFVNPWITEQGKSVLTAVQYGGNTVASVVVTPAGGNTFGVGEIRHVMIAQSPTLQQHFLEFDMSVVPTGTGQGYFSNLPFNPSNQANPSIAARVLALNSGTSSVNSSANQTLGMTMRVVGGTQAISVMGTLVEKIS